MSSLLSSSRTDLSSTSHASRLSGSRNQTTALRGSTRPQVVHQVDRDRDQGFSSPDFRHARKPPSHVLSKDPAPAAMSSHSRLPTLKATVLRDRQPRLGSIGTGSIPSSTHDWAERAFNRRQSRPQERAESTATNLASARRYTVSNEVPGRHQPPHSYEGRLPTAAELSETDEEYPPQVRNGISTDRSVIDGRKSNRALRIWDSVARCLEGSPESIEGSSHASPFQPGLGDPAVLGDAGPRMSRHEPPADGVGLGLGVIDGKATPRWHSYESTEHLPQQTSANVFDRAHVSPTSSDVKIISRVPYPCPFRKRNPARFNVREHEACAMAQCQSVMDLEQHLLDFHRLQALPHRCCRCKTSFSTQATLDEHMMQPKEHICELRLAPATNNPEDGITEDIVKDLARLEEDGTWDEIWRLVFPRDHEVPSSDFHPIVELIEVEQALDDGEEALKASLHDKLRLLLPETIDDSYCTFLTGQLQLVYETHRANITRQCLNRSDSAEAKQPTAPKAPSNHRDSIARRQTRNSRRGTMLQSFRLSDMSDDTGRGFVRPKSSRATSTTISPSTSTPQHRTSYTTKTFSSLYTGDSPENDDDIIPRDSRDSRDSGIGMPCDICESDICRCREIILALAEKSSEFFTDRPKSISPQPRTRTSLAATINPASEHQRARKQTVSPSLRHQPRLRLKTRGISPEIPPPESDYRNENFSPQSFKRRVLREQQNTRLSDDMSWTA